MLSTVNSESRVRPRRLSFTSQTLALLLVVMAIVVALTAGVYTWIVYQRVTDEVQERALSSAQSVAAAPVVRRNVTRISAGRRVPSDVRLRAGTLQHYAQDTTKRTGALFVVITDDAGIRLAHPNPALLGKPVSTSPAAALHGHEVTTIQRGTLGDSARAKVPVYDKTHRVVGEVSVGFSTKQLSATWKENIPEIAATAVAALLLGALASWLLTRRLHRLTLGLQPEELSALVGDQEAVLYGVDNGVIGVSSSRVITVCNAEAARLLDLGDPVGLPLAEAGLPPALAELPGDVDAAPVQVSAGSRILIAAAQRVRRDGRELGWVLTVRDRTDIESLTRQLDAVGTLTDALRAQRHEFAGRLHAVAGLLHTGSADKATEYLDSIIAAGPLEYPAEDLELIDETFLASFVGAKSALAAERGVTARIGPNSAVHGELARVHDVTTVLGNLIDNAVTAAVHGTEPRWIEVDLLSDGADLHVAVSDSGNGIPPEAVADVFADGYSTRDSNDDSAHGHGVGLPLCRRIARQRGGDLWLASPGDAAGSGATFCARLPGVLTNDNDYEDAT